MKLRRILFISLSSVAILLFTTQCENEPVNNCDNDCCDEDCPNDTAWVYNPTYFTPAIPSNFPEMPVPADNPFTEQGVKLGRMLFYDPILSADSTLSCAGCHNQSFAFADDNNRFSVGIDGIAGTRNSMPLFNLAWQQSFFWDGRSPTLEEQVLLPVEDPIEMHDTWPNVVNKLQSHPDYPLLFFQAFGIQPDSISKEYASKAMAQFLRTIISGNSPFDKTVRNEVIDAMSDDAQEGYEIFISQDAGDGDCSHCHFTGTGGNPFFQDLNAITQFRNNGLVNASGTGDFADAGRGALTGLYLDHGKFKVPSLRNIALTAPYMHDGRFNTLEEVLDFYSEGVHATDFTDVEMEFAAQGGVQLTEDKKRKIIAFLEALTDDEFLTNPDYSNPFE